MSVRKLVFIFAMLAPMLIAIAACEANPGATDDEINGQSPKRDGSAGETTEGAKSDLPCDVQKVFASRCQLCHAAETKFGASASLVTHADLTKEWANGKKVFEIVSARIHDAERPMPPVSNAPPSADEIATIDNWIKAGAKADAQNGAACETTAPPTPPKLSCKPTMELKAAKPFTMEQGKLDQYVCFGVDVDRTKKQHIVGIGPKIDNSNILHHILIFESKEAIPPNPTDCGAFPGNWKMITGWAPGGKPFELPAEAGFPQNEGVTHYAVQLHYNNAKGLAGQQDNSGMELCTTEELRPNDAAVLAFGSLKVEIPPRSTTTIACDYKMDERFKGITFFSASPHMHKRGQSMSTRRLVGGKAPEVDVNVQQKFDFENQGGTPINVQVAPGDVFRTECVYKNADDATIKFGEGTNDEMCFHFMNYYPALPEKRGLGIGPVGKRLPGGGFNWVTPAIEDCGLTLAELNALSSQQ